MLTRKKLLFLSPNEFTLHRTEINVCPPEDRQIILEAEMPWESRFIAFYTSMVHIDGEYHLYYTCRDTDGKGSLCYAHSNDGVHFVRPNLGIVNYHGSKNNNMLGIDSLEGNVFYDPEAIPEERFKYLAHHYDVGFILHTSPDGINWKHNDTVLLDRFCDSQNVLKKDEKTGCYLLYTRGWKTLANGEKKRVVLRIEWPDIHTPYTMNIDKDSHYHGKLRVISNEAPCVMETDENDPNETDVYTNAVEEYEGYYVAFPAFYRHYPKDSKYINDGELEVMFMGSADGVHWHRYDRKPYISRESSGRFANRMSFIGTGLVSHGEELTQYGTIFRTSHGANPERDKKCDGKIVVYTQRKDGFVCVSFPASGGTMITESWKRCGNILHARMDLGVCGTIHFALADNQGKPIDGYTFAECKMENINSNEWVVSWSRNGNMPEVVRVISEGKNCRLFSISWE